MLSTVPLKPETIPFISIMLSLKQQRLMRFRNRRKQHYFLSNGFCVLLPLENLFKHHVKEMPKRTQISTSKNLHITNRDNLSLSQVIHTVGNYNQNAFTKFSTSSLISWMHFIKQQNLVHIIYTWETITRWSMMRKEQHHVFLRACDHSNQDSLFDFLLIVHKKLKISDTHYKREPISSLEQLVENIHHPRKKINFSWISTQFIDMKPSKWL